MNPLDLNGKVILISGAGKPGGQGAAEAKMLNELGATVYIGDVIDDVRLFAARAPRQPPADGKPREARQHADPDPRKQGCEIDRDHWPSRSIIAGTWT